MLDDRSEGPSPDLGDIAQRRFATAKSRGGRELRSLLANEREKLTWTYDRGHPMGARKMANVPSNKMEVELGPVQDCAIFEKNLVGYAGHYEAIPDEIERSRRNAAGLQDCGVEDVGIKNNPRHVAGCLGVFLRARALRTVAISASI
jgi:hypothetical protein